MSGFKKCDRCGSIDMKMLNIVFNDIHPKSGRLETFIRERINAGVWMYAKRVEFDICWKCMKEFDKWWFSHKQKDVVE